jgi:hypothetical protein
MASSSSTANSKAKAIAPVVALGATFVATKALGLGFKAITGNAPPQADSPDTRLRDAVLWALATAVTVSMINLAFDRWQAAHSDTATVPVLVS